MRVSCRRSSRCTCLPAAHLRRGVGPLSSRKAGAGQTRQRDIIGNNRTYSEHIRAYPGIFRAYSGHNQALSRAVSFVACRIVRRRIACRRVRRPLTCRHVPARVGDLMSLPRSRSGEPKARRLPCPGPTWRCSRRRPGGLRTYFLLLYRGVLSWRIRRRG